MEFAGTTPDIDMDWRSVVWTEWINPDELCLDLPEPAANELFAFTPTGGVGALDMTPNLTAVVLSPNSIVDTHMSGTLDGLLATSRQALQDDTGPPTSAAPPLASSSPKRTPRAPILGGTASAITKAQRLQLKARFQANPYPNPEEKKALAQMTGLRLDQITRWFANARSRYLRPPAQSAGPENVAHHPGLATISPRPAAGLHHSLFAQTSIALTSSEDLPDAIGRYLSNPPAAEPVSMFAIRSATDTASTYQSPYSAFSYISSNTEYSVGPQTQTSRHQSVSSPVSVVANSDAGSVLSHGPNSSFAVLGPRRGRKKYWGQTPQSPSSSNTGSPKKTTYPCTYCLTEFHNRTDWKRHEQGVHEQQFKWICSPDGPRELLDGRWVCAFCRADDPDDEHLLQQHNHLACNSKSVDDRTFYRRDHLSQHLQRSHRSPDAQQGLDRWRQPIVDPNAIWKCGFCEKTLQSWNERADHLVMHFRAGESMVSWRKSIPIGKMNRGTCPVPATVIGPATTSIAKETEHSQAATRFQALLHSRIRNLSKTQPNTDIIAVTKAELANGTLGEEISRELERLQLTGDSSCPLPCPNCHPPDSTTEPLPNNPATSTISDLCRYTTSKHSFYEVLGLLSHASDSDIRSAFQSSLPRKNIRNILKKSPVRPEVVLANFILSETPLKTAYDHLRAIRDQIISFSTAHGSLVIKAIPIGTEKDQFLQLLMTLRLPLPITLDFPFGAGLVGGPVHAQFENLAEAVTVSRQLRLQNLQVEHHPARHGEGRIRDQRPQSLADVGLEQSPQEPLAFDPVDPSTLPIYKSLLAFSVDPARKSFVFPTTLPPHLRTTARELARYMRLHASVEGPGPLQITHPQTVRVQPLQPSARSVLVSSEPPHEKPDHPGQLIPIRREQLSRGQPRRPDALVTKSRGGKRGGGESRKEYYQ